ncbi:MAG: DMT family transporter [Coriobacteriia bacterium]|nr:DMT family transporter [Coriobacteriia bacterium]
MSRTASLAMVVVSAACFGTLAVLTPLAYQAGASPLPLLAWRFMFAAVLLAVFATIRDPRSLRVGRGDFLRYSALALTGYGAASVCFFFALKFADAAVVAVLLYAYPALVTIAAWTFLGEKATWSRGLAVLTTFIGCAMVVGLFGGTKHVSWPGIMLGMGAAVGYTLFNLLSHRWLPGRSQLVMMTYTFGIASVGTALLTLLVGQSLSAASWQPQAWWLLGAIVVVPTFIAVVLYLQGIRGLGPSQAAVVSTMEPLFTIVLAWAILGQTLSWLQVAGAALVLGGVVASELVARQAPQQAVV